MDIEVEPNQNSVALQVDQMLAEMVQLKELMALCLVEMKRGNVQGEELVQLLKERSAG